MKKKFSLCALALCMLLAVLSMAVPAAAADSDETLENHKHDYSVWKSNLREPDCKTGATGIGKYGCSFPGCTSTSYNTIEAKHKEGADLVETEGTCEVEGTRTYTCTKCETEITEKTGLGNHKYAEKLVAATCQHGEQVEEICSTCGKSNPDFEPVPMGKPADHDWQDFVDATHTTTAATCDAVGSKWQKCTFEDCTEQPKQVEIEKLGHDYDAEIEENVTWINEPTCEYSVGMLVKCSRCDSEKFFDLSNDDPDKQATEHDWKTSEDSPVEADCNAKTDGYTIEGNAKYCPNCGTVDTENGGSVTIAKWENAHKWEAGEKTVGKAATCKEDGYYNVPKTCSECGATKTDKEEIKSPSSADDFDDDYSKIADQYHHFVEDGAPLRDPTCESNGVGKVYCTLCETHFGYKVLPASHNWESDGDDGYSAPTCTTPGSQSYTCGTCGATKDEPIDTIDHVFDASEGSRVVVNPDKNGAAGAVYVCQPTITRTYCVYEDECGKYDEVTEKAQAEHTEGDIKEIQPDCTEGMVVATYCSVCGEKYLEEPVTGEGTKYDKHSWVIDTAYDDAAENPNKAATCQTDGYAHYKCENGTCEATKEEKINKSDEYHDWDEANVEIVDATCEHGAGIYLVCKICGEYDADLLPEDGKLDGHEWVLQAAVPATCTKNGTTAGYVCKYCGADYDGEAQGEEEGWTAPKVDPATNHAGNTTTDKVHTVIKAATCQETGTCKDVVYCSVCKGIVTSEEETLPVDTVNGHDYDVGNALRDPTCTAAGVSKVSCKNEGCSVQNTYVTVPAEHQGLSDEPKKSTPATCTTDGEEVFYCSVCKEDVTFTIKATGHDFSETPDKDLSVKASCVDGKNVYKCQNTGCDATYEEVTEGNGNHTLELTTTPADCENAELVGYVCTTCQQPIGTQQIKQGSKALGHEYDTDDQSKVIKDEAKGYAAATCTKDGTDVFACEHGCGTYKTVAHTALGHDYVEDEDASTLVGNCGQAIVIVEVCSRGKDCDKGEDADGNTGTRTIELGTVGSHKLKHYDKNDATCTATGNIEYWQCETCKLYFTDENNTTVNDAVNYETAIVTEKTDHTKDGDAIEEHEPNCLKAGYSVYKCKVCEQEFEEEGEPADPEAHVFKPENVTQDSLDAYNSATCGTTVTLSYVCDVCEETIECADNSFTVEHVFDGDPVKVDATCWEAGSITYTCTRTNCSNEGNTKVTTIAQLKHVYSEAKDPDASTEPSDCKTGDTGTYVYYCINPGCKERGLAGTYGEDETWKSEVEVQPEHTWVEEGVLDATCEHPMVAGKYCSTCHEYNTADGSAVELGEKADHTWGEPEGEIEDCEKGGKVTKTCSVCGETDEIEVEEGASHKWGEEVETPATCTEDQKFTWTCSVCGKESVNFDPASELDMSEFVDKATGHTPTTVTIKEANCKENGSKVTFCSVCDVDKLDEDYKPIEGKEVSDIYKMETLPATGEHEFIYKGFEGEKSLRDPSCTETGVVKGKCIHCEEIMWVSLPATGHSWMDNGDGTQTCLECGETETMSGDTVVAGAPADEVVIPDNEVSEPADEVEESADEVEESADEVEESADEVDEAADEVDEAADEVEEDAE